MKNEGTAVVYLATFHTGSVLNQLILLFVVRAVHNETLTSAELIVKTVVEEVQLWLVCLLVNC